MSTQSPQSGSPSQIAAPVLPSQIEPNHRHSPVPDVESSMENIQDEGEGGSKSPSPELPSSDKSTTSDEEESGGEPAKALTPTYDEETQETAMVPDSAEPTPTSSLPALPSSAVKKLASPFPSHPQANSILTPSRLSKGSLEKLQQDLLVQDDTTLTDLALATGDDSISLQSDLTIADLDSDDWKQMVISYGAEPRSDDEEIFDSLAQYNPSGNSASRKRRENRVSASARKAARAGTAHTPSKSASRIESAITPIRSTGRTIKTYGKKGHRASTSTGSEAELQPSTRTTTSANTTSEESDCVEVTTARKAGVLRHVTPDGTVLGNLEAYTPSKRPQSTSKGKSRATGTAVEEDYDMDLDLPELSPVKKEQQKLEKKNIRKREREEKKRIRTPSLSPPHSAPAPFVPLSTAAPDGKALSALEIIAQMKAKNKPVAQTAQLQQSAYKKDDDLDLQLAGDIDLKKRVVAMQEDDSDDDDLVDSKALFESVKNAPRLPIPKPEAPVASTSKSTFKVRLPMDKASQSLNKLFKTRQAEEARGWYGIDGTADREKEEAAKRSASASSEDRSARIRGSDSDGSSSDSDSDSSLPDAPPIAGSKGNKQKKQKSKKRRRLSDGNFERVATELHAGHEDSSIVDAIHFAQDQLEEDRRRAEQMRAQEARKFWKSDEQMTIDPFKPYETAGTKGLDYALRQGILDGLANPAHFPVELVSPFIASTTALLSSVSATYSLFHLIAHPCTDSRLANRVLPLLRTLLIKLPSGGALDTDVDLSAIIDSLAAMGAKKDSFTEEQRSSAAIEDTPQETALDAPGKVAYTAEQRQAATLRIMHVLRVLVITGRIEKEKYPSLVILLFRMVLDTTDHHMRESATQALRIMMNRTQDQATLSAIAASLHELMSTLSFRDRYVAISFLPLDFARGRALMRGLVCRLLFPSEQEEPVELVDGQRALTLLSFALSNRKPSSPFFISADLDDFALYYGTLMLQYAITDLPKYLVEDLYSDDDPVVDVRATQARDNAHGIVNGIMDIDSKLRSNLRAGNPIRSKAKNALARMQHSLEYHLQAAQIKVDKLALKRRLGNKTLAQPVDGKVGEGQITINSFFKASTPSLA